MRSERGLQVVRSRQTLSLLRGPLTRREVGALGQTWTAEATPGRVRLPCPRALSARWLAAPGRAALGLGEVAGDAYEAAIHARFRVRGGEMATVVHRLWRGGEVATVLEDGWLSKRAEAGVYGGAPAELHDDAAVAREVEGPVGAGDRGDGDVAAGGRGGAGEAARGGLRADRSFGVNRPIVAASASRDLSETGAILAIRAEGTIEARCSGPDAVDVAATDDGVVAATDAGLSSPQGAP